MFDVQILLNPGRVPNILGSPLCTKHENTILISAAVGQIIFNVDVFLCAPCSLEEIAKFVNVSRMGFAVLVAGGTI